MGKVLERAKALEENGGPAATQSLPADAAALVNRVHADRSKLLGLAETILLARAPRIPDNMRPNSIRIHFTSSELSIFDSLSWDKDRLAKEAGRCMAIYRWQRDAADPATRTATAKRLKAANAALAQRGPQVQKELAALQQELAGLQRAVANEQRETEKQHRALDELRKLCSKAVKEQHEQATAAMAPLKSRAAELTSKIAALVKVEALNMADPQAREKARLHALSACPEIADDLQVFLPSPRLNRWDAYCATLQPRIAELSEELDALQATIAEKQAATDAILDIYAR